VYDPLDLRDLVADELAQREESGYRVESLAAVAADAVTHGDPAELATVLGHLEQTSRRPDWAYTEPTDLTEIEAQWPAADAKSARPGADLADRIRGAWIGRCAGCTLGKPVEGHGWNRARIRDYLRSVDVFPLTDYIPVSDEAAATMTFHPTWPVASLGRIKGIPRDDDVDYTILGLHILETYGTGFSATDVGREWMERLPVFCTYTAERATYRNLVDGYSGHDAATRRNPYREWIGAQIRGDVFGYVSPGDPARAARLAWQDATLSHLANGVYGEMWAAALVAAALTEDSADRALGAALNVVPSRSRLAEALARRGLRPPHTGNDNPAHYYDGAVARAVPVGIHLAGEPDLAAEVARNLAEITHAADGVWAAEAMAATIAAAVAGAGPREAVDVGRRLIPEDSWLFRQVTRALDLLRGKPTAFDLAAELSDTVANASYSFGTVAPETLASGYALALAADGDPQLAIPAAATIAKQADSVPAQVGAITGALSGADRLPAAWARRVETLRGVCIPALEGIRLSDLADTLLGGALA
jgi:ADP-ribosylglycohydrolase